MLEWSQVSATAATLISSFKMRDSKAASLLRRLVTFEYQHFSSLLLVRLVKLLKLDMSSTTGDELLVLFSF